MSDWPTRRQALRRKLADSKLMLLLVFILVVMVLTKTITGSFFPGTDEAVITSPAGT